MKQELMPFLNSRGHSAGDEQFDIGKPGAGSTIFTEKSNRFDFQVPGNHQGTADICTSAAGGKCNQDVAGLPEGLHLSRKNLVEFVIIPDCRQIATLCRQ